MHLLSGSLIDLDATLFVQAAIFFVAFFVLRAFVFKPMISLFEAREEAIEGARAEARRIEKQAERKAITFDEEMRRVRVQAGEERERLRQEGLRLERQMLDEVRRETQQQLEQAQQRLRDEARQVRRDMETTAPALGREVASKLLGREVRR